MSRHRQSSTYQSRVRHAWEKTTQPQRPRRHRSSEHKTSVCLGRIGNTLGQGLAESRPNAALLCPPQAGVPRQGGRRDLPMCRSLSRVSAAVSVTALVSASAELWPTRIREACPGGSEHLRMVPSVVLRSRASTPHRHADVAFAALDSLRFARRPTNNFPRDEHQRRITRSRAHRGRWRSAAAHLSRIVDRVLLTACCWPSTTGRLLQATFC